jgi:hypothetical protein
MKLKIDHCEFGEIIINGKKFHQILISKNKVLERDEKRLEETFNSSHFIGDWEKELLFSNNPDVIIIGNGYQGILKVDESLIKEAQEKNIKLIINFTPEAVSLYNQLVEKVEIVNCLIHTTC